MEEGRRLAVDGPAAPEGLARNLDASCGDLTKCVVLKGGMDVESELVAVDLPRPFGEIAEFQVGMP